MSEQRIVAVTAGLSTPSSSRLLSDRLAGAAEEALREAGGTPAVETVELRDHARGIGEAMAAGFPTGDLKRAVDAVAGADGLIAVTPVFNASYSGLFKSFFDLVAADDLEGVPVLAGATGGSPRHSLVLEHAVRPMFAYLRAVVAPTAVYAASEDWGAGTADGGRAHAALADRIARAGGEFAALVSGGPRRRRPGPYEDPVPFERLLRGE
ncbi:FMN reductase [Nocardiopsis baichengensis]|uniref:FMN reductase n=1 Tax=Nocardiopsis baichengensis TaxID=280240 RepID=UPI0003466156|nr:FMN reductase [Nocardiopsis baichengensis]